MESDSPQPTSLSSISDPSAIDMLKQQLQAFFSDGLVIVVGSGLSSAEGLPGMYDLAEHLRVSIPSKLKTSDESTWNAIDTSMGEGVGLEAALIKNPPTTDLESLIVKETATLLEAAETKVFADALEKKRTLRLARLLPHVLKPREGLPIVTTNYDRLIELAAELSGFGVDTMFVGSTVGNFDEQTSRLSFLNKIELKGKNLRKHLRPKVNLFKPHGSLDWFIYNEKPVRVPLSLSLPRLIITPGLNKFKSGYFSPFDTHRDRANAAIDGAARFLILGYGFNDDHLETHLVPRLKNGRDCLLLTRTMTDRARQIACQSSGFIALESIEQDSVPGTAVTRNGQTVFLPGKHIWDINNFVSEVLEP